MPNTREKLIDLIYEAEGLVNNNLPTVEMVADHLIANGVTVNEWISVKDRLPEKDKLVLCVGKKGGMFLGEIHPFLVGGERNEVYCYVPNSRQGRYATHWMPLPQPPKGE